MFKTLNNLPSKDAFDRVNPINNKPPVGTEGLLKNSDSGVSDLVSLDEAIISEMPNLHKSIGISMSTPMSNEYEYESEGFIKLPRSLISSPHWKRMRLKYQKVFLTILYHTSYRQRTFSIKNNLVTISPGQFCTSIRSLVDLCNEGVSFKEDKIDKNIVARSVSLFFQIRIATHEVRHGICIFTITQSELYEHFKTQGETQGETKVRHNRDTNKERIRKNKKPTNLPNLPSKVFGVSEFSEVSEVSAVVGEESVGRSVGSPLREKVKEWLLSTKFKEKGNPKGESFSEEEANDLLGKYSAERIAEVIAMIGKKTPKSMEAIRSQKAYLKMALFRGWK